MCKKIITVALLAVFLFSLTACAQREAVTVYQDDAVCVTRQGRITTVSDALTGEAYTFTLRRTKRAQDAAEAAERARMTTTTDTDTLSILTARDIIIIVEKTSGQYILIKAK